MTGFDIPAQACHLHLAGGRIQRPGDPPTPLYRGAIDSSAGAIEIEILADPGGLYDPRFLVEAGPLLVFGHGQMAAQGVDEPEVGDMKGWPLEILLNLEEQQVALEPLSDQEAAAYRVPVLTGTMSSSIGTWSATYVDRELTLALGTGSYART